MFKLSNKIHCEQSKFEIDIVKINQEHEVTTQKASYKRFYKWIEDLVSASGSAQPEQYLKSIAANIYL